MKTVYPLKLKQQWQLVPLMLYAWRLHTLLHSYNKLPHMLYAWRLCTLWNSNDSPTHALCLKTLPSEAQTAVPYIRSMPEDCTFTPCNSNNSPTHALCLKTLPSEAQTLKHAVPYMLYVSRLHVYPVKLEQQSHTCSMPEDLCTLWNSNACFVMACKRQSDTCSMPKDLCTLWNSNACFVMACKRQSDTCSIAEDRVP